MFGLGKKVRTITIDENGNVTDIDDGSIVVSRGAKRKSASKEKNKRKPYNDNGREYNGFTGFWAYTPQANGNANPCQVTEATDDIDVDGVHVGGWWS